MIGHTIWVDAIDGAGEVVSRFQVAVVDEPGSGAVDFYLIGGARNGMTWMVNRDDLEAVLQGMKRERRREES